MPPDEPERWHVQKGIPLALITGLLFQLAVIVWGAAILFNKVDDHARRFAKLEATDDDVRRDASRISEQLAHIDERLAAQTDPKRRIHERLMAGRPLGVPQIEPRTPASVVPVRTITD